MRRQLTMLVSATSLLAACGKKPPQPQAAACQPPAAGSPNALLDPGSAEMRKEAPATYRARFETSAGNFTVEVTRAWAPGGADRLFNLVCHGFFDGTRFFRVIPGFVVQFGLSGSPQLSARWHGANIPDDPVRQHNARGTLTFATAGPNTRTTQLFINYRDNVNLDGMGFAPVGRIVEGMDVVDHIYAGDGERPNQGLIETRGTAYLAAQFPRLDTIARAVIVP
jgi:peptidyl-prolyl cis-trans isomerase A (cyclophilin A)